MCVSMYIVYVYAYVHMYRCIVQGACIYIPSCEYIHVCQILREQMLGRVPCGHVESQAVFAARAADNERRVQLLEAVQVYITYI